MIKYKFAIWYLSMLGLKIRVISETCSRFNPLKPNDAHIGRTAPLNSRRCISYI